MKRRIALLALPFAAALALTASAGAESYAFSGVLNGSGCSAVHPIYVAAPAAIEADVATTAPGGQVLTEILGTDGSVLAGGARGAQATTAGTYGIRVCYLQDPRDPDQITYVGNYNVAALAQTAQAAPVGAVAGVSATLPAKSKAAPKKKKATAGSAPAPRSAARNAAVCGLHSSARRMSGTRPKELAA
jgi:hypothetical protein